jgi:aminoglycoside phosphotransferase (APT) family kinase protein
MTGSMAEILRWAARAVGPGVRVTNVQGLREGAGPWLIRFEGSGVHAAVLRIGDPHDPSDRQQSATEVAALLFAERHALTTPRVMAADLDGGETGAVAVLTTVLPGSSRIARTPSADRMRALGGAAAALHAVAASPTPELPLRRWPVDVPGAGFVAGRREPGASPVLTEARRQLGDVPVPREPTVFVHGDLWQGNTMWIDDGFAGLVDWDCAGVGPAGVDLGSLRCDAAVLVGQNAADQVLDDWERTAGAPAENVAHWDVVAALNTPADMAEWLPAFHDQGRTDLDAPTVNHRRDAFLRRALDRLLAGTPSHR